MLDHQYYGYDYHSRQPCDVFACNLQVDEPVDLSCVDAWLTGYLGVASEQLVGLAESKGGLSMARAVIERALIVHGVLMQAQNAPCFERGRIVAVEPSASGSASFGDWRICLALPVVDNVARAAQREVFGVAVKLVAGPLSRPPSHQTAEALFAELDGALFARLPIKSTCSTINISICEILYGHGVPFRHIGGGVVAVGQGRTAHLLHTCAVDSDSSIGGKIAGDKRQTARLLRVAGLPTPVHRLVRSSAEAVQAAEQLGWPVVVKPTDQERSIGVSIGLTAPEAVTEAFDTARRFSANVIVERQIPGVCHRVLVARDKVIYAVRRLPKSVQGNGEDSIAGLIAAANERRLKSPPWKRLIAYPDDALAQACVEAAGFTMESIPDAGQTVPLRPQVSEEWGGVIDDLTESIHPDNIRLAVDAARALGLTIAGVDLMTTDIAAPWHENGAAIIEMNYNPQFLTRGRKAEWGTFVATLVEGSGRIPIHVITGEGDLHAAAVRTREDLAKRGVACHIAGPDHCENPHGEPALMLLESVFDRGLALAMRSDVEGLIFYAAPAELFRQGLPVDQIDCVTVIGDDPHRANALVAELERRFIVLESRTESPRREERANLGMASLSAGRVSI